MKKLLTTLTVLLACLSLRAQTNDPVTGSFLDKLAVLGSITNWTVAPYVTIAPDAPTKFGGGIIGFYNFNNYVGAGPGIDWLGGFNLVSANVTLRLPTHPFGFIGLPDVVATPIVLGGIATPFGGAGKANGGVATIEGVGLTVGITTWKKLDIGAGYAVTTWTGAGKYSGRHHQIFGTLSKRF